MGRFYDNWERLVEAVMRREQFRQLSLLDSRSPSTMSLDSDFSLSSRYDEDVSFRPTTSPLHPDDVRLRLAQGVKEGKQSESGSRKVPAKGRNAIWRGLLIFRGFSSKKGYGREERELQRAKAQTTLHGLKPVETSGLFSNLSYEGVYQISEEAKRRAEISRLQELHTLKAHIESLVKAKGINIDLLPHSYTV